MDKRLLEQVQKALQAQQDTIKRQEKMLDDRDKDIAELRKSLRSLVATKTRELERLPALFESLENTVKSQTSVWQSWQKYRKSHTQTQGVLISELFSLGNAQIQLVELLKKYQSAIVPPDYLESSTAQLESSTAQLESETADLETNSMQLGNDTTQLVNELANVQSEIEQSQTKITGSQEKLRTELSELDKLLSKQE